MLRLARDHLETNRLFLRKPALTDTAALAVAANDARVANMLATMPHPYGEEDAANWIARATDATTDAHNFVVTLKDDNATLIGATGYGPSSEHEGEIELGYWITPEEWNNGYATEACAATLTHAFCLSMVDCMTADAQLTNAASGKVLEKLGFHAIGERTRYSKGSDRRLATMSYALHYSDWLNQQAA